MNETSWAMIRIALIAAIGIGSAQAAPVGPSQAELDKAAGATDSWMMTNKSYDGHRYVALDQITPKNAAQLKPVCTYDSGLPAQAQSTPGMFRSLSARDPARRRRLK